MVIIVCVQTLNNVFYYEKSVLSRMEDASTGSVIEKPK